MFDRLLDGNRIEDTVTQNGMQTTVPKAMPPITVTWPDAATAMSTPPFADQVLYNSEPFYGPATAYVLLQPRRSASRRRTRSPSRSTRPASPARTATR